jgi:hypothetical protein
MKRTMIVVLGGLLLAGCAVQGPDYEHIANSTKQGGRIRVPHLSQGRLW